MGEPAIRQGEAESSGGNEAQGYDACARSSVVPKAAAHDKVEANAIYYYLITKNIYELYIFRRSIIRNPG